MTNANASYGGLLLPLDMFRVSQLAALFGDVLASKARNILDAKMIMTRHAASALLLVRIEGHVVGDDEAEFWRENVDLAAALSQALPRQVVMFYVQPGPPETRREGYLVAQAGQILGGSEATADRMPAGSTADDWPVAQICKQMRLELDDLRDGFPGGPRIEVPLAEPHIDDQAALMTLAGRDEGDADADPDAHGDARADGPPSRAAAGAPPQPPGAAAKAKAAAAGRASVEEDMKRRAAEHAAEVAAAAARAEQVRSGLRYAVDEHGLVAVPQAELTEADILRGFIVSRVEGDLPPGLPRDLTDRLQGKRIDVAVKVDFLSEVFLESAPLTRPTFEEKAEPLELGGRKLRALEVLGPRLGYGMLVSSGKAPHVFVSRRKGLPLPSEIVLELLGS